jgi:hypothetical protein
VASDAAIRRFREGLAGFVATRPWPGVAVYVEPLDLIFVHNGDCAGSSVEQWLGQYARSLGIDAGSRTRGVPGSQHWTAMEYRTALGLRAYDRCFTFTFVRNPYSKLLTKYNNWLAGGQTDSLEVFLCDEFRKETSESDLSGDYLGQNAKLEWLTGWRPRTELRHWANMYAMISDESDRLMVDYVGRVETLSPDWLAICEQANLPASPLPHTNSSHAPKDYGLFTPAARDAVNLLYGHDIELFGWTVPASNR